MVGDEVTSVNGEAPRDIIRWKWVTDDADPILEAGHPGVRVWGAAMDVDALPVVEPRGTPTRIAEGLDEPGRAERQALASFCLVLLNLNEFVYVD